MLMFACLLLYQIPLQPANPLEVKSNPPPQPVWHKLGGLKCLHQYTTQNNEKLDQKAAEEVGSIMVTALRRLNAKQEPELTVYMLLSEVQLVNNGPFLPVVLCEVSGVKLNDTSSAKYWVTAFDSSDKSVKRVQLPTIFKVQPATTMLSEDDRKTVKSLLEAGTERRRAKQASSKRKRGDESSGDEEDLESENEQTAGATGMQLRASPRMTGKENMNPSNRSPGRVVWRKTPKKRQKKAQETSKHHQSDNQSSVSHQTSN
jgi:hypothetical protein